MTFPPPPPIPTRRRHELLRGKPDRVDEKLEAIRRRARVSGIEVVASGFDSSAGELYLLVEWEEWLCSDLRRPPDTFRFPRPRANPVLAAPVSIDHRPDPLLIGILLGAAGAGVVALLLFVAFGGGV